MELSNKEKLAALKKQIRAIQEQRIRIETFEKKARKSTQKWTQEIRQARKLVKPGEILPSENNVRVRIETAEFKLNEFSENQKVLRNNYKQMTETVYQIFKEIEGSLNMDEKIKLERQLQYCIKF